MDGEENSDAGGDTRTSDSQPVESPHRALIRAFNDTMREEQSRAAGTGFERDARWKAHMKAALADPLTGNVTTGNSANAALAAGARASSVCHCFLRLPGF